MSIKFIIFDLDRTLLCSETKNLFIDVKCILHHLKLKGYKIALASYNAYADKLLEEHNISQYFDYIIYEDMRLLSILGINIDFKLEMLTNLLSLANVSTEETLFFDDQQRNIDTGLKLGIKTCKVKNNIGITLEIFKNLGIDMSISALNNVVMKEI